MSSQSKKITTRRLLPGLSVKDGYTPHPFDLKYGVKTSGLIAGRHLGAGHAHDKHNTAYYGVAPSVFKGLLKQWMLSGPAGRVEETSFIDIGAGMGRAVLLAGELPFKEVVGVELNKTLAKIAERNLVRWRELGRAQTEMRVVNIDALEFEWPAGPCVAFMFNPFGAVVMRRLLLRMAEVFAERQGEPGLNGIDLLYVNHEQEVVIERQKGWKRFFVGQVARSREDAIADHRIMANQPEGEYASANYEDCSGWRWAGKSSF
jgi:predicted RNA methylase